MSITAHHAPGAIPGRFQRRIGALLEPYIYLSPAIVLIVLVMFVPLVIGISFAFQDYTLISSTAPSWIGLTNFETLMSDRRFWGAARNTLFWTVSSVSLQFFLGLGLALLLNRPFFGRRIVQALVLLPWAVPGFLTGLTWAWLFNPIIGPISHWMVALGLFEQPDNLLADPQNAMWGPVIANVWFGVPFFAVTLLAALQSIPDELYEAGAMDGASLWQSFTKITLPYLAPMIAITVLLRTIWVANFADLVFIMTGGGPANSTQILPNYIFTTAFRKLDFGYASAVSVVLLLLLLLYAAVLLRMRQTLVKI